MRQYIDLTRYCPLPLSLYHYVSSFADICLDWHCVDRVVVIGRLAERISRDNGLGLLFFRMTIDHDKGVYSTLNLDGLLFDRSSFRSQFQHLTRIECYHGKTDYRRIESLRNIESTKA